MCLATVYDEKVDSGKILCRNITKIETDGDTIRLYDIMGDETIYEGRIVSAELSSGVVILAGKEGAA